MSLTPAQAMANLVPDGMCNIHAIKDGNFSSGSTWDLGREPDPTTDIICIDNANVFMDIDISTQGTFKGMCICDPIGSLTFLPDRNTGISVATTIVMQSETDPTKFGRLSLGTALAPIMPQFTCKWVIGDRGVRDAAQRIYDPLDLSGGIISMGRLESYGAVHTPYALPSDVILAGIDHFDTMLPPPADWKVGDVLLFVNGHVWGQLATESRSETRTIENISGNTITLDSPLKYDHESYKALAEMGVLGIGILPNAKGLGPVCKLTPTNTISSLITDDLTRRGHVMQMHVPNSHMQDTLFLDNGRTDASVQVTKPRLDANGVLIPGTDANTIARYGGHHNHFVTGGTWGSNPCDIIRCPVWGKARSLPKVGHDQHGSGNSRVIDCVGYNVVTVALWENGSETGLGRGIIGVDCTGYGDSIDSPRLGDDFTPDDNFFQGSAVWVTSGGVEILECQAWRCSFPIVIFPANNHADMLPGRGANYFLSSEINPPASANMERPLLDAAALSHGQPTLSPTQMPVYVARCYANGAINGDGLFFYNVGDNPTAHPEVISQNFADHCANNGLRAPYNRYFTDNGGSVYAMDWAKDPYPGQVGLAVNVISKGFTLRNLKVGGYITCTLPFHGNQIIDSCEFTNQHCLEVPAPWGGSLTITNSKFTPFPNDQPVKTVHRIWMRQEIESRGGRSDQNTDLHPYETYFQAPPGPFTIDGAVILSNTQLPDFVPFPIGTNVPADIAMLVGLTNAEMVAQYQIQIGGHEVLTQTLTPHPDVTDGGGVGVLGRLLTGAFPPGTPTMVKVPDVASGINAAIAAAESQAQTAVSGAGLVLSSGIPLVTQMPSAGSQAMPGSTVTVQ